MIWMYYEREEGEQLAQRGVQGMLLDGHLAQDDSWYKD